MRRRGYSGWHMVWALAVTETISYGVLYYSFAAYLLLMQQGLGTARPRWPAAAATALLLGGQAAGVAALLLISGPVGVALFVLLFGLGFGVLNIARPDLLARYAPRHLYARLSGVQALLVIAGEAAGPTAAAALRAATGSYTPVFLAVAFCSLAAALLFLAADRARHHAQVPHARAPAGGSPAGPPR